MIFGWTKADAACLQSYASVLTDCLNHVNIPVHVLDERYEYSYPCNSSAEAAIDDYYNAVVNCIK